MLSLRPHLIRVCHLFTVSLQASLETPVSLSKRRKPTSLDGSLCCPPALSTCSSPSLAFVQGRQPARLCATQACARLLNLLGHCGAPNDEGIPCLCTPPRAAPQRLARAGAARQLTRVHPCATALGAHALKAIDLWVHVLCLQPTPTYPHPHPSPSSHPFSPFPTQCVWLTDLLLLQLRYQRQGLRGSLTLGPCRWRGGGSCSWAGRRRRSLRGGGPHLPWSLVAGVLPHR